MLSSHERPRILFGYVEVPMRVRACCARAVMAAQFPDRTSLAGVNHDPPKATTFGSASQSAALSAPMPPVGQNLIRGKGPERAFSAPIPPDGTAGKNLNREKPYPIPCINSEEVATPRMNGMGPLAAASSKLGVPPGLRAN